MDGYLRLADDIGRLADLLGANVPAGDERSAEAIGLAVGLAGAAVIALLRIADALEARS